MPYKLVILAAGLAIALAGPLSGFAATTIFADDFNRNVSSGSTTFNNVGNGWLELGDSGNDVALVYDGAAHLGVLRLRDELSGNPDAAASYLGIDTTGFGDIQILFDWKPLSAAESSDKLYVAYCLGNTCSNTSNSGWISQPGSGLGLGGSGWTLGESFELASASNHANLNLRFWTDVSDSDEGVLIDNVRVVGSSMVSSVPEPEIYIMLAAGLGLVSFVTRRRNGRIIQE